MFGVELLSFNIKQIKAIRARETFQCMGALLYTVYITIFFLLKNTSLIMCAVITWHSLFSHVGLFSSSPKLLSQFGLRFASVISL